MPRVFRQQYTRPIPPDAERVTHKGRPAVRFKGTGGRTVVAFLTKKGDRYRMHSPKWYGWVAGQAVPLCTNKTAAELMLAELVKKAEMGQRGVADPFEEHHLRPLAEHLADYRRELEARGNAPRYVDLVNSRLRDLLDGCGFRLIPDLSASRVMDWLATLRRTAGARAEPEPGKQEWTRKELAALLGVKPASVTPVVRRHRLRAEGNGKARRYPRATVETLLARVAQGVNMATTNQYLTHLKAFCTWLVDDRRTGQNPVAHLRPGNAQVDRRHDRRELTADELRRLLAAARDSARAFRGLTGRDRYHLYATACGTGFRAGGLASLTPESFDLDTEAPTVSLAARSNKSRKPKVQPLPPDVADLLREYLRDRPACQPVWPGTWAALRVGADMLRIDLDAAGIPYAVEGPDGPLYADFHALRHSYLTLGGRAGIDLRTLQELAGHSDPKLTARYSHRRLYDLTGAVEKLPRLLPDAAPDEEQAALRATGTDGACCALVGTADSEGGQLRVADETERGGAEYATSPNSLISQGVEACRVPLMSADERAGDRIRTDDVQLGKRATLSVQKPTEVLRDKSLRQIVSVCKVVRGCARISENTRYLGVGAGRNPVVTSVLEVSARPLPGLPPPLREPLGGHPQCLGQSQQGGQAREAPVNLPIVRGAGGNAGTAGGLGAGQASRRPQGAHVLAEPHGGPRGFDCRRDSLATPRTWPRVRFLW
jgi:integrase